MKNGLMMAAPLSVYLGLHWFFKWVAGTNTRIGWKLKASNLQAEHDYLRGQLEAPDGGLTEDQMIRYQQVERELDETLKKFRPITGWEAEVEIWKKAYDQECVWHRATTSKLALAQEKLDSYASQTLPDKEKAKLEKRVKELLSANEVLRQQLVEEQISERERTLNAALLPSEPYDEIFDEEETHG